ncbi:MAG: hypothetical protein CM15mP121_3450 [Bacteroidota bacterium]|nr:MAG: hypothetical protein CM15mP121_3450 [Bacteroidota bacterium]
MRLGSTSLEELTEMFQLKNVVSAGANFDLEKLKWYNHKQFKDQRRVLVDRASSPRFSAKKQKKTANRGYRMVKERANTVSELWGLMEYLFLDPKGMMKKFEKNQKDGLDKICSEIISLCERHRDPGGFCRELKNLGRKTVLERDK